MQAKIRIDKWLWAARFFKTRALASQAVVGGHVHVNGERVKPARPVKHGDELKITKGYDHFVVIVVELHDRRGPATLARTLYEETEVSIENRKIAREHRRLANATGLIKSVRRPGKRDRRLIRRFVRENND